MVWCSYCGRDQQAEVDEANGFSCCTGCGRVLDDTVYSSDTVFMKQSDGSSMAMGSFVADAGGGPVVRLGGARGFAFGGSSESHERTLMRGRNEIAEIAERLAVRPREDMIGAAHRLYQLALNRNFTRGRRVAQVAAACLYLACRQEKKPFLLIDFADLLQINVYVLGAVYLQLLLVLRLENHEPLQAPLDPSLFIHRFADGLNFGRKMHGVANTALRLVASMKRDWIQTGRKPNGICGAALLIAAHIHGFERSKSDVVAVVHVCEQTVRHRLHEIEDTEAGRLTPEEFEEKAKEWEELLFSTQPPTPALPVAASALAAKSKKGKAAAGGAAGEGARGGEGGVSIKTRGRLISPMGCAGRAMTWVQCGVVQYDTLARTSGGLVGGANPPAWGRGEREKRKLELRKRKSKLTVYSVFGQDEREAEEEGEEEEWGRMLAKGQRGKGGVGGAAMSADAGLVHTKGGEKAGKGRTEGMSKRERARLRIQKDLDAALHRAEIAPLAIHTLPDSLGPAEPDALRSAIPDGLGSAGMDPSLVDDPDLVFSAGEGGVMGGGGGFGGGVGEIREEEQEGVEDEEEEKEEEEEEEEEDTLSDIEDHEVDGYLLGEEEVKLKTLIWTEMNKDYLEEQEQKRAAQQAAEDQVAAVAAAAAAAASKCGAGTSARAAAAAAAAAAVLQKGGLDRKRRRKDESALGPAQSAAEAAKRVLDKKSSAHVNMEALGQLFSDGAAAPAAAAAAAAAAAGTDAAGKDRPKKQQHVRWADEAAAAAAAAGTDAAGVAAAADAVAAGAENGPLAGGYPGTVAGGYEGTEAGSEGVEPWGDDGALGGYGDESAAYDADSAGHGGEGTEPGDGLGHTVGRSGTGLDGGVGGDGQVGGDGGVGGVDARLDGDAGVEGQNGGGEGGYPDAVDGDEAEYHDVNGVQQYLHVEGSEEHYNADGAGEAVWGAGEEGGTQLYGADGVDPDDQYMFY
ncbi:hypothetical protein CLOP_g5291 [Closterium sp. NIES-67]|nr:hypothetical protein CLOP_g5291 [Closterium sp. NIES-67]